MRKSGSGLDVPSLVSAWLPLLYRSVVEEQSLRELLRRIGASIGAEWSVVLAHPHDGSAPQLFTTHGLPEAAQRDYAAYFHRLEPWQGYAARAGIGVGTPALFEDMVSVHEFRRTEYYQDFWRPHADLMHTTGSLFAIDEERYGHIAFPRARRFGPYPSAVKNLLAALNPHFGAALRTRFELERQRLRERLLSRAFDSVPEPLLLIDATGRVEIANPAAGTWLLGQRHVRLFASRLICREADAQRALLALLRPPARSHDLAARSASFLLGGEACQWTLTPLIDDSSPGCTQHSHLLHVSFPERQQRRMVERWTRANALSLREQEVCLDLLRGQCTREIAAHSGLAVETIRSQIKSLFLKLGVHSQGELQRLARSG